MFEEISEENLDIYSKRFETKVSISPDEIVDEIKIIVDDDSIKDIVNALTIFRKYNLFNEIGTHTFERFTIELIGR